jgi:putative ABC transport system substrate-binding protein
MKTKINLILLIGLILLISCNNSGKKDNKNIEVKEIAVLKYVTHPALDELENAYVNRLDSLLKTNDNFKGYSIKKYNANASSTSANSIAKSFEHKNIALILTIATPAAIEVANINSNIFHLYGAVADPIGAKIIPSKRSSGIQNSGESIIREALIFIKTTFGQQVKIGTIYNPKEQNSIYVQGLIKKICSELGLSIKQVTTESTSQLNGITNSLCSEVDVIYSANDNTVNSGVTTITSVTSQYNKPFIIGDLSTLKDGALFAIGLKYSTMGNDLAEMSYQVILENSIQSFPPQGPPKPEIWINEKVSKELGFNLNDSIKVKFNIQVK